MRAIRVQQGKFNLRMETIMETITDGAATGGEDGHGQRAIGSQNMEAGKGNQCRLGNKAHGRLDGKAMRRAPGQDVGLVHGARRH